MKTLKPRFRLSDWFPPQSIIRDGQFSHLDQANCSEEGALVYSANIKFLKIALKNSHITAIITTPELISLVDIHPCIVSENPRLSYYRLYQTLSLKGLLCPSIDFGRGQSCKIHETCIISPKSFIDDEVTIDAYAVINDYTVLKKGSYIGPGTIIGANGLMPVWDEDGNALRIPHGGGVKIGRNTTILSNSVIVKSIFSKPTTIGNNTYIGILSNIGHDTIIGDRCLIAGNCVIAGGTIIEDGAKVWSSSSITHGSRIGKEGQIQMGSIVVNNVDERESVSGNFAYSHRKHVNHYLQQKKNHEYS